MKRWKRLLIWSVILVALWLGSSLVVAYMATRRGHPPFAESPPPLSWGRAESLRLTTSDGEELGAWFIPGRPDRPVVLLLHGHHGCRGNCLRQAEIFASAGCPTMLVSQRAHGDSSGDYNDVGYGSRRDVPAAVEWLEKNHAGRAIVIYGQSMGAASAVFAADQLGTRVRGYILESPYKDLRTAVWNRTAPLPVFGVAAYWGLLAVSPLVLPDLDKMSPRDAAAHIPRTVPVLILAGTRDHLALPEEASAVHERVADHSQLIMINGTHGRLQDDDPSAYRDALVGFVEKIAR